MHERFKGCISKCVILIFVPVMSLLIGCKSDSDTVAFDRERKAEVEVRDKAPVENDQLEQEAEVLDGSQKETMNRDQHTDVKEIYGRFLNGELTVAWKKEQVPVGKLFWDNDIEYCFYDIDGDGIEELHIRDSVAYYAVRVCDHLPQILFEGWWGYEPVVSDGQYGILHFYHGYGNERIEFMTLGADGTTEGDGEFYWSDHNQNGNMDAEDYFRGFTGWEEIDMEQYVRYRDGQLKKRDGNELAWKERQLESFSTWQEAYAAYIARRDSVTSEDTDYALIYVDDDEIPELYIDTSVMATGEFVVSFYDGNIGVMNRERVGLQYMEYSGLLYSQSGNMGFYPCNIYRLDRGKFSEIGAGWYSESYDGENIDTSYFWEESPVTEEVYGAHIKALIDTSVCVEPSALYTKEEILQILGNQNGQIYLEKF